MDDFDFENGGGRKRGRPATGNGRKVRTTITHDLEKRIIEHAEANFIDFNEALRQLLERGLAK